MNQEEVALRAGLKQMIRESGGTLQVEWYGKDRAIAIIRAWLENNPRVQKDPLARALGETIHAITVSSTTEEPRFCGGCEKAFTLDGEAPVAFSLVSSGLEEAEHAVGTGYCAACAEDPVRAVRNMSGHFVKAPIVRNMTGGQSGRA